MSYDLDLLLVNVGGIRKRVYQDLGNDFSAIEPPFWCALTAGFLRKKGFKVDILDANALNLDHHETAEAVAKRNARLAAVVVYSQQANTCTPIMTSVGELCRAMKTLDSRQALILTGWHPSALPERTLREEACDMVAQGEGFLTLLGLLENKPPREIPGLWWKQQGDIASNGRAPNIEDLSGELSEVAWDLLPMNSGKYRAFNWMCLPYLETRGQCASLLTSLGCPYECTFCAIHGALGDRRVRYWSPEWVLRQCDILVQQYRVKHINLVDELFVLNPRHYLPIAEGLIERRYDLNICAFARVDRVDAMSDEELATLKRAGFNWLKLGIETGDPKVLRQAHKGTYNGDVVRRVVGRIHAAGMDMCANYLFGLPGDTWESMQENLNLAMELNAAFPSFFCAMAPPGSQLYEEALANGTPLPETWEGYAQQGYDFLPLRTEHLSAADVLRFRDWAFDVYFTNPRYLHTIEQKFGPAAAAHIKQMTAVKLKRKILEESK